MTAACSHCGGTGLEPAHGLFEVEPFGMAHPSPRADESFDAFWARYPRKQAKATAIKSWKRMSWVQQQQALAALPQHIAMWNHEGRGTRLVPMASTWLNQQRWDDDLSGYVDDRPAHKPMPGRTGIAAALANRQQPAIGDGR